MTHIGAYFSPASSPTAAQSIAVAAQNRTALRWRAGRLGFRFALIGTEIHAPRKTVATRHEPCAWLCRQRAEQSLGLFQITRIKAFGEPVIDRSKKIAGLIALALIAPQPRHAHRRPQLPGLCLLLTSNRERVLEILLRFRRIRFR